MTRKAHPTVSVIMPVYNVQCFVAEAVMSVLAQSFTDFELIIIDDGGNDRSIEICRTFDDPRIRIRSQANRGLAGARNAGIRLARGRYIALIDSDDAWEHDKLAHHVAHLDLDSTVGVSYAAAALIDSRGNALGITQRPKLGAITARDVFCGRAIMNGSTPVFRREMLADAALPGQEPDHLWYFDESLRRSEDVECWTRLALTSPLRFEALPLVLTRYRINAGGLSSDVIRQLDSWDAVCAKIATISPDFVAAHAKEARGLELRYLARRAVQMCDRGLGLTFACAAIAHWPRLLWQEPAKTFTTLAACAALRVLPAQEFRRLVGFASPALAAGL